MTKQSDCWQTPLCLFYELDKEFNFDIDLCATKENSKCRDFCENYLEDQWGFINEKGLYVSHRLWTAAHNCAFMNPPYSNPEPFIQKAWEDSKYCKIVCLVKCDPSAKWWGTFWEYGENIRCVRCMHIENSYEEPESNDECDVSGHYYSKYHGPKLGCEVRFFPKRIKFDPPLGSDMTKKNSGPAFGCALVIMNRTGL